MEKIAFRMFLKPGNVAAYKQRHDDIWPELVTLLRNAGVTDDRIATMPTSPFCSAIRMKVMPNPIPTKPLSAVCSNTRRVGRW